MKFRRRQNRRRFLRMLVVGASVMALAAPSALAVPAEQFLGQDQTTKPSPEPSYTQDASPGTPKGGAHVGNGVSYAPSEPLPPERPPVTVTVDDGFGWGDAGIGAAVAAGLILLSMVALGGVSRFRARLTS